MSEWINAKEKMPENGSFVVIHAFGWSKWYYETAIYNQKTKLFQRGNFGGSIDESAVDCWMKIPPISKEQTDESD